MKSRSTKYHKCLLWNIGLAFKCIPNVHTIHMNYGHNKQLSPSDNSTLLDNYHSQSSSPVLITTGKFR